MISIVVPIYNCITTLERCVQSILDQTLIDWELLLVDDGATDGSGAVCDLFAAKDARIRVFHKTNGGVSSARNLGLDNARGEYVMFCDSDDWAEPDWCEKLYRAAQSNPDCLPVCNYYRNTSGGESVNRPEECGRLDVQIPKADFFCLNRQELLGIPWNKIFRCSILAQNHIRFDPDISLGEDLIFTLDYLHQIPGGFFVVNEPLYHYTLGNTASLSTKYYPDLAGIYRTVYARTEEEMRSIPGAWEKWDQEYLRSYFFAFDRVFRNTWSVRNPSSRLKKWRYNAKQFHSGEFQRCREAVPRGSVNILQYYGLKTNSFYIYWMAVMISEFISRSRRHR